MLVISTDGTLWGGLGACWRQHLKSNSVSKKWRNSLENKKKKYSCVKFLWQGQFILPLGEPMLGTAPPGPVGKALLKGEKRVQGACSKEPRVGTPP